MADNRNIVLSAKDIEVKFRVRDNYLTAIRGVSLDLYEGETFAIVGESGSGKSVFTKTFTGMLESNGSITNGSVMFEGKDITKLKTDRDWEGIRGAKISTIFQDPMTALNPVMTVGEQIAESLELHQNLTPEQSLEKAKDMLKLVGIAEARANDYPHQFSGGMKQRVVIAIALACSPKLLIADEPTTALDVTIQAQVLELMKDLINNRDMSMLMITHSLGIVAEVCDDMAVMYAGRIVEKGTVDDVFNNMRHPYTEGLFNSLPNLKEQGEMLEPIKGLMPDPADLPPGCTFAPRCPYATEACSASVPELHSVDGSKTHFVACHAYSRPGFALRRNQK